MRKTLLLLATCLLTALPAVSAAALFINPAESQVHQGITCAEGKLTGAQGVLYSRLPIYNISHFRKSNVATSAIAVTIDLSAASKVERPTRMLTFESKHELGLMATPAGITGNWHGAPWGESVSYAKLANHPAAFTRDGSSYITLTVVASGCCGAGWNGIGGIMGYDVNGELTLSYPLLASAENKEFKSISANLDFIKIISASPAVSQNTAHVALDAGAQATRTQRKYLKYRGEWLSPTAWTMVGIGGLLIVGIISIAAFRKGRWQ